MAMMSDTAPLRPPQVVKMMALSGSEPAKIELLMHHCTAAGQCQSGRQSQDVRPLSPPRGMVPLRCQLASTWAQKGASWHAPSATTRTAPTCTQQAERATMHGQQADQPPTCAQQTEQATHLRPAG